MLGKLIKYEFKATGRILLPLYGALLVFALINRLLFRSSLDETINNTFGTIGGIANILSVFAYGCTMAAVFVVTFFVMYVFKVLCCLRKYHIPAVVPGVLGKSEIVSIYGLGGFHIACGSKGRVVDFICYDWYVFI